MRGEVVCVEADGMGCGYSEQAWQSSQESKSPSTAISQPVCTCKQTLWKVSVALRLSLGLHLTFLGIATKKSSVLEGAQRRTLEMLSG